MDTNSLEVCQYSRKTHGQTLWTWWMQRDQEDYDCLDLLPMVDQDAGHGCVVSDDNGPVVAGFAMMTVGVGIAWFERLVSRPGLQYQVTRRAGALVYGWLEEYVKEFDYHLGYAHLQDARMGRELSRLGFVEMGKNMLLMGKILE